MSVEILIITSFSYTGISQTMLHILDKSVLNTVYCDSVNVHIIIFSVFKCKAIVKHSSLLAENS